MFSHTCVVRLQAVWAGQSVATAHAHAKLVQRRPAALVVQSAQTPLMPHPAGLVPATHMPFIAAEQQPVLQGVLTLQLALHTWVPVLQAVLLGQSAELLQPH